MSSRRLKLIVSLFLIMATLLVYWQVRNHDFVNLDDNLYVTKNRHVQAGFTREGILWAFTSTQASNWHPLTWLSHMLDYTFFGLEARGHHLTNMLLHVINSVFLFLLFSRMTGAFWQSGFVAALFALHPLHVESVAWISERKDVLSTLFWILTMWACGLPGRGALPVGFPSARVGPYGQADARDPAVCSASDGLLASWPLSDWAGRSSYHPDQPEPEHCPLPMVADTFFGLGKSSFNRTFSGFEHRHLSGTA